MDHPNLAGVDQGRGDLQGVVDRVGGIEWSVGGDQVPDVGPDDVLEGNEMQTAVLAHVEHPCDVVVIQTRRRTSLVAEPLHRSGVSRLERAQDLQRHRTTQAGVAGTEDRTHPTHTNPLVDDEMIQLDTDRAGHRHGRRTTRDNPFDWCRNLRKQPAAECRTGTQRDRFAQPLLLGTDHRRRPIVGRSRHTPARINTLAGRQTGRQIGRADARAIARRPRCQVV